MSARRRLPKEVFVIWEEQGDGEAILLAADKITEHANKEGKVLVGTYRLVREDDVTLVTKISQRKVRP